ncbi:MAG: patatin-like phospholipase family protein [Pedococcus sp.]
MSEHHDQQARGRRARARRAMSTAFVLSGGGSLGAVQVGMLRALAEQDIRPDLLVGTSAGAVNALWVAQHGMSTDSLTRLARLWQQLRRQDVFPVRPSNVVHGVLGRSPALSSSEQLAALVARHCDIEDLRDAPTAVHMVAADLLSGNAVLISSGSPVDAVRASAAVPGIYPPIWLNDRWLIDGAFASPSGVAHAVRLGATEVYVLPTGVPCALSHPPRSAIGVAVHALTLLIEQRLIAEVHQPPRGTTIRVLPPLCPVSISAADFSQAAGLIHRAHRASARWIEEGGLDLLQQDSFLSLHDHAR